MSLFRFLLISAFCLCFLPISAFAADVKIGRMEISEDATLNPMEFKLEAMPYQEPSLYVCYTGYIITKGADHKNAMTVHQKCADAGYTRSMLWLAYIYQNGYYVAENPELSAYWDKRAAEAGNEVGMFNFGLDLLRGYGVAADRVAGHYWVNRAADAGHKHAGELRAANYDLAVVTPDADEAYWSAYQAGGKDIRALGAGGDELLMPGSVEADGKTHVTVEDESGILNPADTGREMLVRKIEMGVIDSVTCSLGIGNTKYDAHELSKKLTRLCAEAGYAKAMTWMSYLENNGLGGGEPDPVAATKWDRRAAETGDTVGLYNYGLALIRGHGVPKDEALGRRYVDQAAQADLEIAQRLQQADYDLDEVTPDADNWQ